MIIPYYIENNIMFNQVTSDNNKKALTHMIEVYNLMPTLMSYLEWDAIFRNQDPIT